MITRIIDTENPSVKWLEKSSEESVQMWKQETSTTGEEATGEGITTEVITVTRTFINNQAKQI